MKNRLLRFLTSISPLFPDKLLSSFIIYVVMVYKQYASSG